MKVKDLVAVMSSATIVALYKGKGNGHYLHGYGVLEELIEDFGDEEVLCIWPSSKDVLQVNIK